MKRAITSAAIGAIVTMAGISQAHAWGLTGSYSKQSTTNQRSGQDSISQGKNSGGRDRWEIKNDGDYKNDASVRVTDTKTTDNRDYSNRSTTTDSRDMSDKRNLSDNRHTTTIDSRNLSDNRTTTDSRDMSDRRVTMDNRMDNQRHQSHDVGGAFFNKEVSVRAGHDAVSFGPITGGTGNVMDASVNGNAFQIGSSGK